MSNENYSFVGPIERFNNAEDLIKALEKLRPMITGVEIRKTFVDGPDVTCIYNLNMKTPIPEVRCTELCHVDNGKNTSTELFFDATPFREMFAFLLLFGQNRHHRLIFVINEYLLKNCLE